MEYWEYFDISAICRIKQRGKKTINKICRDMLQPSAVGGKHHQVKPEGPLLRTPKAPAKDLLLIEAPYWRKIEDSLFGCKQMAGHMYALHGASPPSPRADAVITMSPAPQPTPFRLPLQNASHYHRKEQASRKHDCRHFHFDIGMHKTYLT